jgi:putative ABC transport system permease protein
VRQRQQAGSREFGNALLLKEVSREVWGFCSIDTFLQDIRFGARQLRKNPGFTFVVVLTLALGIGACPAIFSVVNHVLLLPLAYPQSERLVVIWETKLPQFPEFAVAPANYIDWRAQATSFEQLAAVRRSAFNLTGSGEPVRVAAERVTPNYLTTFRTRPSLGRDFSDEEVTARANVVLLTHSFWLRQFGGRPDIVGEIIQLNGQAFTIIGVLPTTFRPGDRAEVYTPLPYDEDSQKRGSKGLLVVGRLKADVPLEQARSELRLIADRLAKQYPDVNTGWSVKVTPMLESTVTNVRRVLFSLFGAVGFLLLIACANVANLLLARASTRSREIAVRAALGASRRRIIGQLLNESVLLGCFSGMLGLLIAILGVKALLVFAPSDLPRLGEIGLDGRALGFSFALALLTGIVFGLVPAFHASGGNFNVTLKSGGRSAGGAGGRQRLRGALGVAEVAMALVLLIGAGLLFRSFTRLLSVNPGFQSGDAFAVSLSLPEKKYRTDPQQAAFPEQATARLQTIPGVKFVAAANMLPLSGDGLTFAFNIVGSPIPDPASGTLQTALFYSVSPDYFKAMEIPIARGRCFTAADGAGAPLVALINGSMARRCFAGQDPIGQRISLASGVSEVVGIVADVKHSRLDADAGAQT